MIHTICLYNADQAYCSFTKTAAADKSKLAQSSHVKARSRTHSHTASDAHRCNEDLLACALSLRKTGGDLAGATAEGRLAKPLCIIRPISDSRASERVSHSDSSADDCQLRLGIVAEWHLPSDWVDLLERDAEFLNGVNGLRSESLVAAKRNAISRALRGS